MLTRRNPLKLKTNYFELNLNIEANQYLERTGIFYQRKSVLMMKWTNEGNLLFFQYFVHRQQAPQARQTDMK